MQKCFLAGSITHKCDSHSISSIMIGYSLTQKGYILVNAENNAIFISRDVKFVENIFPFKHNKPETGNVLSMLWTLLLMIICK